MHCFIEYKDTRRWCRYLSKIAWCCRMSLQPDVNGACAAQTNGLTVRDICNQAATPHGRGKALHTFCPVTSRLMPTIPSSTVNRHRNDQCFILIIKASSTPPIRCAYHAISRRENKQTNKRKTPPIASQGNLFWNQHWRRCGSLVHPIWF